MHEVRRRCTLMCRDMVEALLRQCVHGNGCTYLQNAKGLYLIDHRSVAGRKTSHVHRLELVSPTSNMELEHALSQLKLRTFLADAQDIYDAFVVQRAKQAKLGDPLSGDTEMGPQV